MYNDSAEQFTISDSEGSTVGSGIRDALNIIRDSNGGWTVESEGDVFEIRNQDGEVIGEDLQSVVTCLNQLGFEVVWQDDVAEQDDYLDEDMSIKDYLNEIGVEKY